LRQREELFIANAGEGQPYYRGKEAQLIADRFVEKVPLTTTLL
jgi:hypothetical protein